MIMTNHGLDSAVAVDAFVDGKFPPTATGSGGTGDWIASQAFPNLTFNRPMHLLEEPGTNRIWIAEHAGRIYAFDHQENTSNKTLLLDISTNTHYNGESGLLSFAFHPRYGLDSNYVYLFYQTKISGNNHARISRFEVPSIPGPIDQGSEMVLIQQRDRANNHNGGSLFFGNDGYLYISVGDEGGGNNPYDNGQDLDIRLFGGVLRIDVDRDASKSHAIRRQPALHNGSDLSFTDNYLIPNDNPFLDPSGGLLEEFYALGFRNPHRMTYDPSTDQIWLADVGQNSREEVDLIVAGGNYQWSYKEGLINGPHSKPSSIHGTDQPPVHEYSHANGNSIIGGYVYRGPTHGDITGKYIFSDYGSKRLWALTYNPSGSSQVDELMTLPFKPSAFGIDQSNELYILQYASSGKVYKLTRQNPGSAAPPQLLSQTGVFQSLEPLIPEDFAIPFELNAPFWSDGASKQRWMIIPNDGTHNSASEQITFSEEGNWQFPAGAVLVKHFEMELDETNPSIKRKLETRFLIHGNDGNYYGLSYRWNDAQTDASLLPDKHIDTLTITTAGGNKQISWYYPSQGECLSCHNESSAGPIGASTHQLNGDGFYPLTSRTANQLKTLSHLNIFDSAPDTTQLGILLTAKDKDDATATLEERAKSYLDINCSSCHQPGAGIGAHFDTRLSTSLQQQGLIYADAVDDLGISGARLVVPGNPEQSILYQRINSVHSDFAMPQLAKNLIDVPGVALIKDWINSIPVDFTGSQCPPIQFNAASISSYGGIQDEGTASLQDDDQTIVVENNGWKSIPYSYTITPNTVLEFDFKSSIEGEEHAIGLDNNDDINDVKRRIKLHGTQNSFVFLDYDIYNGSGTYQHFVIPIGSLYTGSMDRMFFTTDHDNAPSDGNSFFKNVSLHEGGCTGGLKGQTINFEPIESHSAGDAPFDVVATASSGLTLNLEIVSGPATIAGNTVSLTGQAGMVEVKASQAGDATYDAAPEISREFWVVPLGKDPGTGLTGTYYDNKDLTNEIETRVDAQIDFYWGSEQPINNIDYSSWSVAWTGEIEAPVSETFTFTTSTDDGVRLWVDNQLIIDHWIDQPATDHSGTISLNAWDRVPIRLEYYQENVYASAQLRWASASISPTVVPSVFLQPELATGSFPVELLSFEAIAQSQNVLLRWETTSEQNSDYFEIERSTDGAQFVRLNQVSAAGFSNEQLSYQSLDPSPETGINYYRLKQVDRDGSFSYSQIREVIFSPQHSINIYPVPLSTNASLTIELYHPIKGAFNLQIYHLNGQELYSGSIQHTTNFSQHQISDHALAPGIYVLSLTIGKEMVGQRKIMVQ
ncbi:MAG: PQQ-dependent sugar dehydrogenase [Bacteroidota bacterium]